MKVHWTDTAQAHLDAIYAYIKPDQIDYPYFIEVKIAIGCNKSLQRMADSHR
jgi:hypothetical protein